jgi:hypothetical protein
MSKMTLEQQFLWIDVRDFFKRIADDDMRAALNRKLEKDLAEAYIEQIQKLLDDKGWK